MEAHRRGNPAAFAEIVRRYGELVLGYLIHMCGNREQAEDFFQETFRRVHEKAHTFTGSGFRPWLLTIATHTALNGLRKNRRGRFVSLDQGIGCTDGNCEKSGTIQVADDSPGPSEDASLAEQKEQVRGAIDSLPTRQRATLVLAYYQQLSYPEVADVMGCSVGTVKTQIYRAVRTLADKLPDWGGELK